LPITTEKIPPSPLFDKGGNKKSVRKLFSGFGYRTLAMAHEGNDSTESRDLDWNVRMKAASSFSGTTPEFLSL
jgi:hypothetical protein